MKLSEENVRNLYLEIAEAELVHSTILRWTGTAERIIVKNILHDSFLPQTKYDGTIHTKSTSSARNRMLYMCGGEGSFQDRVQVNVC